MLYDSMVTAVLLCKFIDEKQKTIDNYSCQMYNNDKNSCHYYLRKENFG